MGDCAPGPYSNVLNPMLFLASPKAASLEVPLEGWLQIVLFIGHYEGYFWRQAVEGRGWRAEGFSLIMQACTCSHDWQSGE